MPPKKGRKRRVRERRHSDGGEARVDDAPWPATREEARRPSTPSDLPKLRVRMAGFVLAVITVFFGILNVAEGLGGSVPVLVTGLLLIVLALVLGVLSLIPERVRALLTRK